MSVFCPKSFSCVVGIFVRRVADVKLRVFLLLAIAQDGASSTMVVSTIPINSPPAPVMDPISITPSSVAVVVPSSGSEEAVCVVSCGLGVGGGDGVMV